MGVFHGVILTLPVWCGAAILSIALFVPTGTVTATRQVQMHIPGRALLAVSDVLPIRDLVLLVVPLNFRIDL